MIKNFENKSIKTKRTKKVTLIDTKNNESYEVDENDKDNMVREVKVDLKADIPPELDEEFGIDDDLQQYEVIINFVDGKRQVVSIIACDEKEALKEWNKIENNRFKGLVYNWSIQRV